MANTRQAKKRIRQSEKSRQHNSSLRSLYRSAIKKVIIAIGQLNKENAAEKYKDAASIMDKMVSKGIIHKNKAARYKSRLNLRIKNMA